jgi:hypothetical protein
MEEISIAEKKREVLAQIFDIALRINMETGMACWIDVSGHVGQVSISVAKAKKDHFLDKITKHETYYDRDWSGEELNKEFFEWAKDTISALNSVLGRTFTKKYTAYCNLIDMGCGQVFVSEPEAKRWVKKMKRKYDSVHAIVGYREELV